MNLYIADMHLGHANVTNEGKNYDKRPFNTVSEMNDILCNNWNKKVKLNDTVYILGDCIWNPNYNIINKFKSLNGKKVLIKGNHDKTGIKNNVFDEVYDYLEISDNNINLVLNHFPIMMWNGQHRGKIHLYGHVHNSKEEDLYQNYLKQLNKTLNENFKAYNVGCMMPYMNYTPMSLKEIMNR